MMNNQRMVNAALVVVLTVIAYVLIIRPYTTSWTDLQYKRLLNDAITQCLQVTTITVQGENAPNTEWYERCIKDKGY